MARSGTDAVRENKVRRMARRQGMKLLKSRRRDPSAYAYGTYMLVAEGNGSIVLGAPVTGPYGTADLDQVERYLTSN